MRGHLARKRFGQNFLVDPHYVARIVAAIDAKPGDNLVEIGPGLAALTAALIERAGRIAAIEIDRDLATRLAAEFPPERLTLHVADALAFDFAALGENLRIVGNLPYNISTPLLFHLAEFDARIRDVHVMLQREVVARIISRPREKPFSLLGYGVGVHLVASVSSSILLSSQPKPRAVRVAWGVPSFFAAITMARVPVPYDRAS